MTEKRTISTKRRRRELIELIGGEGLSYGEAARRLGISEKTVEHYAAEIRALSGLPVAPRAALFLLYRDLTAEEKSNGNGTGGHSP